MMSGSILYPPSDKSNDVAVLFIETSGCLPMCGHGTIGTVTIALEQGLVIPKKEGQLRLETPAGLVNVAYQKEGQKIKSVKLTNIPSYLAAENIEVECPDLGWLNIDVAYGGNFYAIVEPQEGYRDMADFTAAQLVAMSGELRRRLNESYQFVHPLNETINGLSHIQWTGKPRNPEATARNAVFYGDKAIDRSPCGTGTSARVAQWAARGDLNVGDTFVHESIIGSLFRARVEELTKVGPYQAIIPSIAGWARVTGINTIFIDDDDPYAQGFQVI